MHITLYSQVQGITVWVVQDLRVLNHFPVLQNMATWCHIPEDKNNLFKNNEVLWYQCYTWDCDVVFEQKIPFLQFTLFIFIIWNMRAGKRVIARVASFCSYGARDFTDICLVGICIFHVSVLLSRTFCTSTFCTVFVKVVAWYYKFELSGVV
jgi:hypothetical protein